MPRPSTTERGLSSAFFSLLSASRRDEEADFARRLRPSFDRMQIHVDLSLPPHKQIKIFSKSKRDSTRDRSSAHPFVPSSDLGSFPSHSSLTSSRYSRAILSALSLSLSHDHLSHLYNHHLHRRLPTTRSPSRRIQQTIILEAEMVPYNERKSKIEEFWKITACAGDSRAAWSSYQPR